MRLGKFQAMRRGTASGVRVRSGLDPKNPVADINWRGVCLSGWVPDGQERGTRLRQGLVPGIRNYQGGCSSGCWKGDRRHGARDGMNMAGQPGGPTIRLADYPTAGSRVGDRHGTRSGGCDTAEAREGRLQGHKADKQDCDGLEEPFHALQWSIDGTRH